MAVVRKNIAASANVAVRDAYVQGVKLLKQENSGSSTTDLGIPGPTRPVSTYDLFVVWHHLAMMTETPPGNSSGRNSAHMGPAFLPWHRIMLLLLEQNLQRVLADPTFGLPYWDWAADGDLPAAQQPLQAVWGVAFMGGDGSPVTTGPFAFVSADPASWRVRIESTFFGTLRSTNRGMRRAFRADIDDLPQTPHVDSALLLGVYDDSNWDIEEGTAFRNRAEGWVTGTLEEPPWLHNRVHVWVGGDMSPSTSPNDPVFYLNHCNVDRIWEGWMQRHGRNYAPPASASSSLQGHRLDDPIASPLGPETTPAQVLDSSALYTYDSLP